MMATMSCLVSVVVCHRNVEAELAVDAVAPDITEVVPFLVEEEAVDQGFGGFQVGSIARTQLLVDCGERILLRADNVLRDGLRNHRFFAALLDEQAEFLDAGLLDSLDVFFGQDGIFIDEDLARLPVNDVAADGPPLKVL